MSPGSVTEPETLVKSLYIRGELSLDFACTHSHRRVKLRERVRKIPGARVVCIKNNNVLLIVKVILRSPSLTLRLLPGCEVHAFPPSHKQITKKPEASQESSEG
jgi:hypothetical protein